ncbi:MAG: tripartite tricarboxylate transporter substrate binding protein [Hyphomicrobiales bacterium]|nr:tripartite tricarboxylate transporter substrate binding protein [Hyphomicrobiales bacterium]
MVATLLIATVGSAAAQTFPDRVIRLVNPFPPGGSVDITARLLAQKLSDNLGHQVIVENRTGAGGNTGAESVAKSDPDGYTLLFTAPGPLAVNQTLYSKGLPFDPAKDFAPIAIFAFTPIVLMSNPDLPVKGVQELIAFARSNPAKVHFGSAGLGSIPHMSGELFKTMTKTEVVHVPYRGTAPAMNDLIGGHIQIFFDLLPGSLPQISTGKVRALDNAGAQRAAALPDLPTVAEQGLPGFATSSWVALVAPARTPAPVLATLRSEVEKVIKSPEVVSRLHELGSEPGTASESEVRAFLDAETKKWAEVIRVSGAKAD